MDQPTVAVPGANGPWQGMEERESFQTVNHCRLAFNVDFSRGYIESRDSFRWAFNQAFPMTINAPQLHLGKRPNAEPHVLIAGVSGASGTLNHIFLHIKKIDGSSVVSLNLTLGMGEPPDPNWSCSFVDTYVQGTGAEPQSLVATIISTPYSTFLWVPQESETTVRRPDMAKESVRVAANSRYYLDAAPFGAIAFEHHGSVIYSGYQLGQLALDGLVPTGYTLLPDNLLCQNRNAVRVSGRTILWSDYQDQFGVCPQVGMFQVPQNETVTGGLSFREQAIFFTNRGIHSIMGSPTAGGNLQMVSLVRGIGCVGPHAFAAARGLVYFMSWDGFYVFDGQDATKISAGIDSFFNGAPASGLPELVQSTLGGPVNPALGAYGVSIGAGIDWHIDLTMAHHTRCAYYQTGNQVMWSVPIVGYCTTPGALFPNVRKLHLTLVFDIKNSAWSVWFSDRNSVFNNYRDFDGWVPGVSYFNESGETHIGCDNSFMAYYPGGTPWDGLPQLPAPPPPVVLQTPVKPITLVYVSAPFQKDNTEQNIFRGLWFRCRSFGLTPANPTPVVPGEVVVYDVGLNWLVLTGEESAFDQVQPDKAQATYEQRQASYSHWQTHPRGQFDYYANQYFSNNLSYFADDYQSYGANTENLLIPPTLAYTTCDDWWTQKIYPTHVESKWSSFSIISRGGYVDYRRAPWVCISAWSWEVVPTGANRGS